MEELVLIVWHMRLMQSFLSFSFIRGSITGAHGLGWLEHPADNREVMSSNLIGPTITPSGTPIL